MQVSIINDVNGERETFGSFGEITISRQKSFLLLLQISQLSFNIWAEISAVALCYFFRVRLYRKPGTTNLGTDAGWLRRMEDMPEVF
ncbi:hypothetical protein ABFP30_001075 [Enterobacter bugandensis]